MGASSERVHEDTGNERRGGERVTVVEEVGARAARSKGGSGLGLTRRERQRRRTARERLRRAGDSNGANVCSRANATASCHSGDSYITYIRPQPAQSPRIPRLLFNSLAYAHASGFPGSESV